MRLFLRDGFDPDAWAYINAVETADGQPLEPEVRRAIGRFVRGCKTDGVWTPIKAACILVGARTLAGALVPLVGTAPTNFNFVSADYNRETGLKGNGSNKYLDTNRAGNADPQNSYHNSIFVTELSDVTLARTMANGSNQVGMNSIATITGGLPVARNRCSSGTTHTLNGVSNTFMGTARSASANFLFRNAGANRTVTVTSETPRSTNMTMFQGNGGSYSASRLSFYSIGEALDLSLLDARLTRLMSDIADAI